MKQSRAMSLIEAIANVVVGYGVAVATQILIFPVLGLQTTLVQNLKLGGIFSLLCRAQHKADYAERMVMRSPWFAKCSIPDDHIDPRRSALFMARWVLGDVRKGGEAC
jgi:hypothetical protein